MSATHPQGSRRDFLALMAGAAATGLPLSVKAQNNAVRNPLWDVLRTTLGDSTQTALLWTRLTQYTQQAALQAQCPPAQRPLSELEWNTSFQASIAQDAIAFTDLPFAQRFYVQHWAQMSQLAWDALESKGRAQWGPWLQSAAAKPTIDSLRAENLLQSWLADSWGYDGTPDKPLVTAPILSVQALRDLGAYESMSKAIHYFSPALTEQWARIKPLAQMRAKDRSWLEPLTNELRKQSEMILEQYYGYADRQWPERKKWDRSLLAYLPVQCSFSPPSDQPIAFKQAFATMQAADFLPHTLSHFCA